MPDIFSSIITNGSISLSSFLICLLFALICGAISAVTSSYRNNVSKSFAVTVLLLPAIVQTVIMMVNGNIGTGIAVAGAFSLVRFRSVPGKAREIASIFLSMTAGLACASGYIGIAVLFTAVIGTVMVVFSLIPIRSEREYMLRVTIPESLNYSDVFKDIFEEYSKSHRLIKVKTSNMGSLFKLYYKLDLKNSDKIKEMIDEIRIRNGNLEVSVSVAGEESEEL